MERGFFSDAHVAHEIVGNDPVFGFLIWISTGFKQRGHDLQSVACGFVAAHRMVQRRLSRIPATEVWVCTFGKKQLDAIELVLEAMSSQRRRLILIRLKIWVGSIFEKKVDDLHVIGQERTLAEIILPVDFSLGKQRL
jgi:hypothetical protein